MPLITLSCSHSRKGFMFIELLFAMGIFGIITAVVLVAINPKKHLCETANAKRHITARELANAINQYEIRTFRKAAGQSVPIGEINAKPLCRFGVTNDDTCLNVDVLVPDYLISLPQDAAEQNPNYAGFTIYRMAAGMDLVNAAHVENCNE